MSIQLYCDRCKERIVGRGYILSIRPRPIAYSISGDDDSFEADLCDPCHRAVIDYADLVEESEPS